MSEYTVTFEKAALKFLRKQNRGTQERIMKAIEQLPKGTDIKRLQGYNSLYRMRIGNIRIIYAIEEVFKIINIENIDNRGDIYKRY